ncbi:dentin sialophosphoprotein [Galleria mellonella]|uniref:Dentin sialophosphoprotein n=1 Tax=Galleria mellonella TaxID=7137 RepID=A0ABM3MA93_GALME|nr:dentin sialophosphoprotein [Galleria mellonella]
MKRMKRHKIKREKPESSASISREQEEHDLAYYIHDRVELVHQIFSSIKPKDLKSMTPECIRHLSTDNVKELCTEELLGISSKRLCAILDGAEPPSDTESSSPSLSPEHMETISLDSISSDEDLLSQTSSKKSKKHKHRRHGSKSRKRSKKRKRAEEEAHEGEEEEEEEEEQQARASRAGLTVLELLELQARARAIRAQLQQHRAAKSSSELAPAASNKTDSSSDDEVEVKEEPAEVVEISSSEDEKPQINEVIPSSSCKEPDNTNTTQKVTKRINDLIITVPQAKTTKKIKLKRNNKITVPSVKNTNCPSDVETTDVVQKSEHSSVVATTHTVTNTDNREEKVKHLEKDAKSKEKQKKKLKKKDRKKNVEKDGSDHDEITLQLSDSEKMDLLEDLDHKNFDKVSSSSSEDSESSSSDSEDGSDSETTEVDEKSKSPLKDNIENNTTTVQTMNTSTETSKQLDEKAETVVSTLTANDNAEENIDIQINACTEVESMEIDKRLENDNKQIENLSEEVEKTINQIQPQESETIVIQDERIETTDPNIITDNSQESEVNIETQKELETDNGNADCDVDDAHSDAVEDIQSTEATCNIVTIQQEKVKEMSDGEITDRDSSEVEVFDFKPEIVYISDEETNKSHKKKKNKKKEKKNKKEKKSKKSKSDFREDCDQNFYKNSVIEILDNTTCADDKKDELSTDNRNNVALDDNQINIQSNHTIELNQIVDDEKFIIIDENDVYEIFELSDDSSCYEVEGTVLSKEPTAEEIEALSAKIDEIDNRQEVVTEEEIREHERAEAQKNVLYTNDNSVENISWKDRYLESKKVKRVLCTSNILNALRKKNKELKRKLEESKHKEVDVDKERPDVDVENKSNLEEGSIDHYNTLEGSTKYVDPVKETVTEKEGEIEAHNKQILAIVTREMKKDAKQILKMYKRLLKYNDMNKKKDPNKQKDLSKKKKKKLKKKKEEKTISASDSQ